MSTGASVFSSRKPAFARIIIRLFAAAFLVTLAAAMSLTSPADARLGGGGSSGSRGGRTFSMPSATPTAPRVSPLQRSAPFNNGFGGARPGFFGGGFGRGLIGGFLGAGLFGLLFGQGLSGGLGGGLSFIGLLFQIGLIYLAFRFVMGLVRRQPAFGGGLSGTGPAPFAARGGGGSAPRSVPITIGPDDYQVFERRLVESQIAYSNGDLNALRQLATPEMSNNFRGELAGYEQQGVVNKLSNVQLLQGDLSEAWREGSADYASVAMRFSLIDATMDKTSGRLVSGDASTPQQVTEVWTFTRPAGGPSQAWILSAIQQA